MDFPSKKPAKTEAKLQQIEISKDSSRSNLRKTK
ncbi:hypothetical protein MPF_0998 [Methanohalophilus portucalensis FDF-1]|uniref:Uncharacterized protein n=1 Tax=Methanohalophilus portucalensis FDF-1 TaxID=523843 RepID=A0A1L9C6R2_9EURY|nr:hypothetical protein MPF_0998 [Methanohalophilus portucalensis FDF-1]